jgi:hypothetical protein
VVSHLFGPGITYWNPICEWIKRTEHRIASIVGLREPPAKGAIVRGIRAADMSLQWCQSYRGTYSIHVINHASQTSNDSFRVLAREEEEVVRHLLQKNIRNWRCIGE